MYWGYIRIIEQKMESPIVCQGIYWGYIRILLGLYKGTYRGCIGIMEQENGNYYTGVI